MVRPPLYLALLAALALHASEHRGRVTFGDLPVPGATVTAVQGEKNLVALSDPQGLYSFPELADGVWTLQVQMLCFTTIKQDVTIRPGGTISEWLLKAQPLDQIQAVAASGPLPVSMPASEPAPTTEPLTPAVDDAVDLNRQASDGFLINGTVNNGASSPFSLASAFGNNRRSPRSMYNGNIGLIADNSSLDARSFSLTGQDTPKPLYNHLTGIASFGGPLKIPHLLKNGPLVILNYQWTRNRNATIDTGLVPALAQRSGDLSQLTGAVVDPQTGLPFPGNVIPQSRISPQATALLSYYPLPNFAGGTQYNYQIPIVGVTHQDTLQSRSNKTIGRKDQISGNFNYQSTRSDGANLFGFLDKTAIAGINTGVTWRHTFSTRLYLSLGYQYSRLSTRVQPFFANRENVSGEAGIAGNNQEPVNWGPPSLNFASGIAPLADSQASFNRNQTGALSYSMLMVRGRHNISFGTDYKKLQFNYLSQQDPRGTFTFTGAATGSDLAGFLLGMPDTSSIAFGNADKYFRSSSYDAFITDDFRIGPTLTLNAGIRWEYGSPITELYGRLVNLDIIPGFAAAAPVIASNPTGPLTGTRYPDSLMNPDKHAFEPRIAISWRPFSASSMVVRAGYGVYYNTSVYDSIATQMAQQSPLSKSLSVQNSPADPLSLANGFNASPLTTPNTFAIDPNFRVGYSQNWQVSVQRDLPGALVMIATYLGIKGTRGVQDFLPNTYPLGAMNPCPSCPAGFSYLTSNGNSTRESGQIQLRRRLHNGLTTSVAYTYSKSIDDSALGGRNQGVPVIAQNWLDLSAERALSTFDQRHLLNVLAQYTSGMGIGGLNLSGWRGSLLKEWTLSTQFTAGSGLPLTPIYLSAVAGTGVTGSVRPDYTGAPLYASDSDRYLNPAAYAAPVPGHWGNAGRDSITGPSQFVLNTSLGRTFRFGDRLNLDLRIDATNALNHVTFPSWNTLVGSAQFGLPMTANAMRSVQTLLRVRF